MGMSSSKSKNKPIYKAEVEGANASLASSYSSVAPKVAQTADAISGLVPSMLEKYKQGDPTVNAAQGYAQGVLGGQGGYNYTPDSYLSGLRDSSYTPDAYLSKLTDTAYDPNDYYEKLTTTDYKPNSYFSSVMNGTDGSNAKLDDMISLTNRNVASGLNANLGTRGLAGGSVQQSILSKALADNETGLRYQDFSTQQARRDSAAAQDASLSQVYAGRQDAAAGAQASLADRYAGRQDSAAAQQAALAQAYAGRQDNAALTETQRRDQAMQFAAQERASAAGMAPSLLAAQMGLLDPAMTAANAATVPFSLASNYASGVGGLLGQYQKVKSTTPWGPVVAGAASNAASAYFGGGG